MTVTAPVSLTKIKAEFGGPNNLSAYIRGGSYVPNTTANANVSTTVAGLAISQFLGATNYVPVTASVSQTSIAKSGTGTSTQTVTTAVVIASGTGGTGSYTFAWQHVSGGTFTLNNPNGAGTNFSATLAVNTTQTGVYRCLVSDGTSSAYTPNVTITLDNPKAN